MKRSADKPMWPCADIPHVERQKMIQANMAGFVVSKLYRNRKLDQDLSGELRQAVVDTIELLCGFCQVSVSKKYHLKDFNGLMK